MLNMYSFHLVAGPKDIGQKCLKEVVEKAVISGITVFQLRDKHLSDEEMICLGQQLKPILAINSTPLIINDRLKVAKFLGVGLHIGQQDIPFIQARKILGEKTIIGLSVENLDQLERASELDVSYLGLSAIFSTPTKSEAAAFWSASKVKSAKEKTSHPLIGIGGIKTSNLLEVLSWGLDGIAVTSEVCGQESLEDLKKCVTKMKRILGAHSE
jgi:thiamine-phosphate pyrophosphorylase